MQYEEFAKMTCKKWSKAVNTLLDRIRSAWFKFKVSFLRLSANLGVIKEHINYEVVPLTSDNFPKVLPNIVTDRFVFGVSYVLQPYLCYQEHWFETNLGNKLLVLEDDNIRRNVFSFRAELLKFFVHFSCRDSQRTWVSREEPNLFFFEQPDYLEVVQLNNQSVENNRRVKPHWCDFSKVRYSFKYRFDTPEELDVEEHLPHMQEKAYSDLREGLISKTSEINLLLTGVEHDGDLISPKGQTLVPNTLCSKCGLPVFFLPERSLKFECVKDGEIGQKVSLKVDPLEYKKIVEYNLDELERFCLV